MFIDPLSPEATELIKVFCLVMVTFIGNRKRLWIVFLRLDGLAFDGVLLYNFRCVYLYRA